jgi:Zn-finger domain-containing protein
MIDLEQRLRNEANDLYDRNGEAMKMWDDIRRMLKPRYGGTVPREMFEQFIEEIADLLIEAAEALSEARTP